MARIKRTEPIEMLTATAIVGPLITDWFGMVAKLDADADVDVGLELMLRLGPGLWPKLVGAELMTDEEVVPTAAVAEFVGPEGDAP